VQIRYNNSSKRYAYTILGLTTSAQFAGNNIYLPYVWGRSSGTISYEYTYEAIYGKNNAGTIYQYANAEYQTTGDQFITVDNVNAVGSTRGVSENSYIRFVTDSVTMAWHCPLMVEAEPNPLMGLVETT
jgi:hypothetical protein